MAITYRDKLETDFTTATASPAVNKPTNAADGDLMLMVVVSNTTATVATGPIAGWTKIYGADFSTDGTITVWYKVASGEGSSWTMTNLWGSAVRCDAVVIAYYNVDQTNPINKSSGTTTTGTAVSGPSLTPDYANSMFVQFAGTDPGTGTYAGTPDASPVANERHDAKNSGGSSYEYIYIQDYLQGTAAALALDITALTSDDYGHVQVALMDMDSGPRSVNKSESITLGETVAAETASPSLAVTDGITPADTPTVALQDATPRAIDKSETIGVADAPTVAEEAGLETPAISKNEAVAVTDAVRYYPDEIIVFEWATVRLELGIGVSEGVGVADTAQAGVEAVGALSISVNDGVGVSEGVGAEIASLALAMTEGVTVTDAATVSVVEAGGITVNVSDGVAVGETVTVETASPSLAVTEGITVTDAATVSTGAAGAYEVSVTDGVTVGEQSAVSVQQSAISTTEGVTVTDAATVSVEAVGALSIAVSETLTMGETVSWSPLLLDLSATETVTVGEAETVEVAAFFVAGRVVGGDAALQVGVGSDAAVQVGVGSDAAIHIVTGSDGDHG